MQQLNRGTIRPSIAVDRKARDKLRPFARSRVDQPDRSQFLVDWFFIESGGVDDPILLKRTTESQRKREKATAEPSVPIDEVPEMSSTTIKNTDRINNRRSLRSRRTSASLPLS